MPHIFNSRRLAESYQKLGVVIHSEAFRNKLNQIRFQLKFQFGRHGIWSNELELRPTGTNLVEISKAFSKYQEDLLEQIDALEETERWAKYAQDGNNFQRVICQEKPMFFYGQRRGDRVSVHIFGEGLNDLVILWDPSARWASMNGRDAVQEKLCELREAIREHLTALDKVPARYLQGAPA